MWTKTISIFKAVLFAGAIFAFSACVDTGPGYGYGYGPGYAYAPAPVYAEGYGHPVIVRDSDSGHHEWRENEAAGHGAWIGHDHGWAESHHGGALQHHDRDDHEHHDHR